MRKKCMRPTIEAIVTCGGDEDDCDHGIEVTITRGAPSRTYGPPENCSPAEPWDIEIPETCEGCGRTLTDKDATRWLEEFNDDDSEPEWERNEEEY